MCSFLVIIEGIRKKTGRYSSTDPQNTIVYGTRRISREDALRECADRQPDVGGP
jgi:hypothetical protein